MGWIMGTPPRQNRHTLRAQKLDAKAARAERRMSLERASRLERKADKAARKGGWF